MRRGFAAIALVFVVILAGVGIGVAAYNAGQRNGIAQGIQQVQTAQQNGQTVQVVHVVDEGRPFFFPGFFLFPLFLFGLFFLIGGIMRGAGRWGARLAEGRARGTKRAASASRRRPASGTASSTATRRPRRRRRRPEDGRGQTGARAEACCLRPPVARGSARCNGSWSSRTTCRSRARSATTSRWPGSR